jgi:hypothetical protein
LYSCGKPTPDKDRVFGRIIVNQPCQDRQIYLMTIDKIFAFKTGYTTYTDTLTVGSTHFAQVVQLDATRLEPYLVSRLQQYQPGDKIAIDFTVHQRSSLPSCLGSSSRSLETVVVNDFGFAVY